jgi:ATP-dependent Clp protease ATP-binding subunit ClpC
MEKYFNYPLLRLPAIQKSLYKILLDAIRFFLIILGISFLVLVKKFPFNLIGFWILVVYLFYFTYFRKRGKKNLKYEDTQNIADYFDEVSKFLLLTVVEKTEIAKDFNKTQFILLSQLLDTKEIRNLISRLNLNVKDLKNQIKEIIPETEQFINIDIKENSQNLILKNLEPILIRSYEIAKELNFPYVSLSCLFLALVEKGNPVLNEFFNRNNITIENVKPAIVIEYFKKSYLKTKFQPHSSFLDFIPRRRWLNRTWTTSPTYFLDKVGIDLTYFAERGELGFIIGHQKEIEAINSKLKREENLNIALVGREGSGRSTVVYHLAYLVSKDMVPEKYFDNRIIQVNLPEIYAGDPAEFQTNVNQILSEAAHAGNVILYFPDFHQILLSPVYSIIWPLIYQYLKAGSVSIIASFTPEGFSKSNSLFALESIFEIIEIEELNESEAITLLTLESIIYEKEYKIIISPQAITKAVILAKKFLIHKPLPASARDLIKEAIGFAKSLGIKFLNEEVIGDTFTKLTGIPIKAPLTTEKYILENLEEIIHQRIVNQDYAVKEVARVLKIYRAGIEKKKGPIASFLFVGPTGVGKTELAKVLAKIYFGGEERMIRLDMAEFQNLEDIEKLIGSEDGKIVGRLTEEVLKNPYSLILLDEFEKAHPQILNLFLPIFDEGYIKDAIGRTIDFSNTLIICTSNALSDYIKEEIESGKTIEMIAPIIRDKLSEVFRVELLNRFSGIIVFRTLSIEDVEKITEILVKDLNGMLIQKFGITIELKENAKKKIIELGYNPVYGARELKRTIEREILGPLSEIILREEIKRNEKIIVDYQDSFIFEIVKQ